MKHNNSYSTGNICRNIQISLSILNPVEKVAEFIQHSAYHLRVSNCNPCAIKPRWRGWKDGSVHKVFALQTQGLSSSLRTHTLVIPVTRKQRQAAPCRPISQLQALKAISRNNKDSSWAVTQVGLWPSDTHGTRAVVQSLILIQKHKAEG